MAIIISKTEALSLADTMGTMLSAIVDAQAQSARATVDFINEVGFHQPLDNQPEKLRTIQFNYFKLDENQKRAEFTVDIPLLALVEIPLVCIKKASISFNYEIIESTQAETLESSNNQRANIWGRIKKPAVIKGRLVDKTPETRECAHLAVSIDLEKTDVPVGLNRILDILQIASSEQKVKDDGG